MTTRTIGIKEFRQNITSIWKEAQAKNIRFIVLHHAKPIFEINPVPKNTNLIDILKSEIKQARNEVKNGKTFSEKEAYAILGL